MQIDSEALARSLGKLQELGGDRGLTEALDEVVGGARLLFGADAAVLWILGEDGTLRQLRATGRQAEVAATVQEQLAAGPALAAFDRRQPVAVADLTADPLFDAVGVLLRAQGVRAALSVPVELDAGPIGALDIYTGYPRRWDASELAAADGFARVTGQLLAAALAAKVQERLAEQLQVALDRRVLIEQAKGALIGRHGLDEASAFELLRSTARDQRRPIVEVASEFLAGSGDGLAPRPSSQPRPPLAAHRLLPADHACWRFRPGREQRQGVAAFVRAALERDGRVVYLTDTSTTEAVAGQLRQAGLQPEGLLDSGQLVVGSQWDADADPPGGGFQPARHLERYRALLERARSGPARGLWIMTEASWQLQGDAGSARRSAVAELERRLDELLAGSDAALLVCQYDATLVGREALGALRATHNLDLSRGRLRPLGRTLREFRVRPTAGGMAVAGSVDMGVWPALSNALRRLLDTTKGPELVVDLSELEFIDGRGVRMLAQAAWALGPSRRLVLRSPPPVLLRIAQTLRLDLEPGLVIEGQGKP